MDYYRQPHLVPVAGKPVLQWPRELPMKGSPAANVEVISRIGEWMLATDMKAMRPSEMLNRIVAAASGSGQ